MDGVEVVGVFNVNAFRKTLEALVSKHFNVEATLKEPPAQDERAARPARNRGKSDQRVSV